MKDLWKSGVLILLIIGVLYIIFLRECKHTTCPPEGQVLIAQSTWDSIQALANKPPTIVRDTVWLKGDIIYLPSEPLPPAQPDPKDTTIHHYEDSLVRKDINVKINYTIKGRLLDRLWQYTPIVTKILEVRTVYIPKIIKDPYPIPKNGLYLYGIGGGNKDTFLFGAGADLITKKETELGYMYQRYGNEGFHSIKIGTKLRFKRK